MTKTLAFVVAGLAALAGCQNGNTSKTERQATPAAPSVTQKQAQQPAVQQPAPPAPPAAQQGQQSGSVGSGTDLASGPGSSGTLGGGSTSGDVHSAPAADQAPAAGTATSDIGASQPASAAATTPDAAATTPGSDEKSPDQRGSVLTNDGAVQPKGQPGGSQPGTVPAPGDSATSATVDSLHVDHADSAIAQPPLGDQATLGASESDRQLVQRIRQSVVDDETISSQGRAVQIQSQDGQIVLKGEVGSVREKQRIGDTAFRESGGKMVVNQLEVRE